MTYSEVMCILLLLALLVFILFSFCQKCLGKIKVIAEIFLILAGIYFGNVITSSLKNKELDLQYLQFAGGMLAEKPTEENAPLREWAITAFQKYADPKLSDEAVATLRKNSAKGFLNSGFLTTGFMTEAEIQERLGNDGGYQKHLEGLERSKYLNKKK